MLELKELILWGVSLLTIFGSILNIKKINLCFWIWSFCNICWLLIDVFNKAYPRAILDVINLATSVWGIIAWHRTSLKESKFDDLNEEHAESNN